jgi:hypothetical protein
MALLSAMHGPHALRRPAANCMVGDAKNPWRVAHVPRECRPETTFPDEVHKHAPPMEDVSAWEAVSNHGHGTWAVASVAMRYGVNKFVMMRGRGPGESDDVEIVLTGWSPGEKLYEEVPDDDEHSLTTPHPKLRIARAASGTVGGGCSSGSAALRPTKTRRFGQRGMTGFRTVRHLSSPDGKGRNRRIPPESDSHDLQFVDASQGRQTHFIMHNIPRQ